MVFRVYKAGKLSTALERDQMTRLIGYLKREFTNRNEDCTLIIEPHIPVNFDGQLVDNKPDALILKDNMLILIEMKGYKGEIIADCSIGGIWKTKEGAALHKEFRNPFSQAGRHSRFGRNRVCFLSSFPTLWL